MNTLRYIIHDYQSSTYITFGIYKGPTKDKDLSLIIQVNLLKVLSYHVRYLLQKIDIWIVIDSVYLEWFISIKNNNN